MILLVKQGRVIGLSLSLPLDLFDPNELSATKAPPLLNLVNMINIVAIFESNSNFTYNSSRKILAHRISVLSTNE